LKKLIRRKNLIFDDLKSIDTIKAECPHGEIGRHKGLKILAHLEG